uniref:Uncharacterized protein n=1 Tax=Glossina pallidipes TaxID=7398 RepID=A0A1A9ZIY0_GLOPL
MPLRRSDANGYLFFCFDDIFFHISSRRLAVITYGPGKNRRGSTNADYAVKMLSAKMLFFKLECNRRTKKIKSSIVKGLRISNRKTKDTINEEQPSKCREQIQPTEFTISYEAPANQALIQPQSFQRIYVLSFLQQQRVSMQKVQQIPRDADCLPPWDMCLHYFSAQRIQIWECYDQTKRYPINSCVS